MATHLSPGGVMVRPARRAVNGSSGFEQELLVLRGEKGLQFVTQAGVALQSGVGVDDREGGLPCLLDAVTVAAKRRQLEVAETFLAGVHDRAFAAQLQILLREFEAVRRLDQSVDPRGRSLLDRRHQPAARRASAAPDA